MDFLSSGGVICVLGAQGLDLGGRGVGVRFEEVVQELLGGAQVVGGHRLGMILPAIMSRDQPDGKPAPSALVSGRLSGGGGGGPGLLDHGGHAVQVPLEVLFVALAHKLEGFG
ncbi:MAG: hypothetical protein QF848_15445 [Planctomycetota bacterium]|nr:hypothetical protein [Planctomycetota bacterium]